MTGNTVRLGKMPSLQWLKVEDIKIPEKRLHSRFKKIGVFEANVKVNGVLSPIHVFEENGTYWLADGQNRLETAKKLGKPLIQCYVLCSSKQDAIAYSVKLNKLRGKVNTGELAEFLLYLQKVFDWNNQTIAEKTGLSKSYVSELLLIAQNGGILEKLKKGLISKKDAVTSCKSSLANIIPKPESQETMQEEKLIEPKEEVKQPLTNADLGITTNLKKVLEEGKRFVPISAEGEEEEKRKSQYMTCDFCGKILSRLEVRWIKVHEEEYDRVLLAIHKMAEAERESENHSSQP
jgi:ParB/RepB/Spo0J family partition protein